MIQPVSSYDTRSTSTMQGLRPGGKPDHLREACEDAEGLFASILLKEGLKPVLDEANEGEGQSGSLLEFSIEEMAREMGRQGMLGVADQFYAQLTAETGGTP